VSVNDGNSSMGWEIALDPETISTETVTFVWLAGLGSSLGCARFDLEIGSVKKFELWSDGLNEWSIKNNEGSMLSFQKDMIDQNSDSFGFMYLQVPTEKLKM